MLVGREGLLAELHAALRGGGVLLYGPAGIGKSSLVGSMARQLATDGHRVLSTTAGAADRDLPYLGLFDLLAEVHDELRDGLPPHLRHAMDAAFLRTPGQAPQGTQGRLAIRLGALELLRMAAITQPLALVCDDAQWLDAATVDVLSCVVPRIRHLPVRTLVAERVAPSQLPTRTALCAEPVTEVAVPELPAAEVETLLRARFGDLIGTEAVRRLAVASDGNPYLAIELGRAVRHHPSLRGTEPMSVPEKLRALVGKRLADLPRELRGLLLTASAVARPTRALLAACHPDADRLLTRAATAGVVGMDSDGAVRFSHPLLAEILYADAAPDDRRRSHEVVAGVVDDPVERARHSAIAHPETDAAVATLLDAAAESAARRGIPLTAAELAELAAERTPATEQDTAARRLLTAAEHAFSGGDQRRTVRLAEAAVSAGGDAATRVTGRLLLVETLGMDVAAREPLIEAALADAGEDPLLAARVWRYRAEQALFESAPDAAAEAARQATRYAERADDAAL
ncbi:MAG: AAA family ATPase, partial [Micromonosporaceae bacterium]